MTDAGDERNAAMPKHSQMIEESVRRNHGLDDIAETWAKVTPATEEEGVNLAVVELRAMRKERHARGRPGHSSARL